MNNQVKWCFAGIALALLVGSVGLSAYAFLVLVSPSTLAATHWTAQTAGGAGMDFVSNIGGRTAVQLTTDTDKDGGALLRLTDATWDMKLADLGGISYSTLVTDKACKGDPKNRRAPYVSLDIDTDGDFIADDRLIFDPARNGTIACDVWQHWNATGGTWLSTEANGTTSLAAYLGAHSNAQVVFGGVSLAAGFGAPRWNSFTGYVDAFTISRNIPCVPPVCLAGPSGTYIFLPD